MSISIEEVILILDPKTSANTITKIKSNPEFNKEKLIEKINEACIIACNVMREYLDDKEVYKNSYDNLNKMSKEQLIGLFLKIKKLYNKTCERCEKLEKENEELLDFDKIIDSLPEDN